MRPTSGLTFGGRYQLSSRIAIGGMGEVWQATDLVIGRTIAIKILKDEYLGDPGFLERFRAEARHAALVNHEGIANVFDYGEEDGSAFLVMELVPGEALSAILERERMLPADRVLDFIAQTATALSAAHAAGLVHRDIKPGNLLITPDNRVKITDFGIARIADQVPLTATGQVMGTVQYLSPEQASGHPASPTTDIYSLGIVAYEALAGRRPFTGESQVAIAMAQINETPPELPATVSEPVRNLVYSCLAKSPGDRPATAAHLARAAQSLRRGDIAAAATAVPGILGDGSLAGTVGANYGQPTASTRVLTATETRPIETVKRHPWTWPLIAIVSLLGVVLIGAVIALLASPPDQPAVPTPSFTTPVMTPVPSVIPSVAPIVLLESDYLGLTQNQAQAKLEALGLQMEVVIGTVAPTLDDVDKSYRINPQGNVRENDIIAVSFYAPIPQPSKPGTPAVQGTPPFAANSTVTVTWPSYGSCPVGHPLTGYSFEITNGAMQGATNPVSASTTSLEITLPTTAGTTTVRYFAFCSELQSTISDSITITSE